MENKNRKNACASALHAGSGASNAPCWSSFRGKCTAALPFNARSFGIHIHNSGRRAPWLFHIHVKPPGLGITMNSLRTVCIRAHHDRCLALDAQAPAAQELPAPPVRTRQIAKARPYTQSAHSSFQHPGNGGVLLKRGRLRAFHGQG